MANEIEVRLVLDDGTYKKGLIKAEDYAKTQGKKIGGSLETTIGGSLVKSLTRINPLITGVATAFAAAFGGRAIISAAIQQENAINGLNQALRAAGTFSKEASESIQAFADEMQRTTVIDGEAVLELTALARVMTKTNEEAVKLTQAAIELSAATGVSADTAVMKLGKTLGGVGTELGKLLPATKSLTEAQLKNGEALDFVLSRFGGSAAAQAKTFGGSIQQLSNIFGDLLESLGGVVTNSKAIRAVIGFITEGLIKIIAGVEKFGKSGSFVDGVVISLLNVAKVIVQFVLPPIEMMLDAFQAAFRVIETGFRAIFTGVAKLVSGVSGFFAPNSQFAVGAKQFADQMSQGFIDSANATSESIAEIGENFALTDQIDQFIDGMTTRAEAAIHTTDTMKEGVNNNFTAMAETIKSKSAEIQQAMRATLAGGISKGIQSITTALIKGGNVFEAFAGAVLGTFGDLAIQLGEFYIAQGIAGLTLKSLDPTGSIAAGAGLIALGTIMKSFFASGGASAQPGSTASGGPVPGGGLSGPASDLFTDPEEVAKRGPEVTVNVAGNILDRRETGLEIVNIINEAFDQQGAVVRTA